MPARLKKFPRTAIPSDKNQNGLVWQPRHKAFIGKICLNQKKYLLLAKAAAKKIPLLPVAGYREYSGGILNKLRYCA
jgi:hypothetical protein